MSKPAAFFVALCSASPMPAADGASTALCSALPIPAADGASTAPEYIHLLPAGEIRTVDGRGPYRVRDVEALMRASMEGGARLVIDENHATDLAAPRGEAAPARGWIVALQSRQDGIWGQVEWTEAGRRLVADKAYRNISPAIRHLADGTVTGVLRASLVNMANLRGLAALHQQDGNMDFLAKLRQELGLKDDADEAAVLAAVKSASTASTHAAQLPAIAKAAGLAENAEVSAILGAVTTLADPAKRAPAEAVTALQQQLTALSTGWAREKAETAVDAAIKAGKIAAPKEMRDHYIARHMADPAAVDKELGAMVSLHRPGGGSLIPPAPDKDGRAPVDDSEASIIALMGVDPEAFKKARAAEGSRDGAL